MRIVEFGHWRWSHPSLTALLASLFLNQAQPVQADVIAQIAFSDFLSDIDKGRINSVIFKGRGLTAEMKDGRILQSYTPTTDVNFVIQHLVSNCRSDHRKARQG